MTDVEYVINVFHVDKEKAESMIANGMNVSYLRNGFADDLNKQIDGMKGNFINNITNILEK